MQQGRRGFLQVLAGLALAGPKIAQELAAAPVAVPVPPPLPAPVPEVQFMATTTSTVCAMFAQPGSYFYPSLEKVKR